MDVTRGVVLTRCIFFIFRGHAQTSRDHILASRGSCVKLCTPIERYCCALFVYSIGFRLVLCFKTFIFYKLNRAGKRFFFYIIGPCYTVQSFIINRITPMRPQEGAIFCPFFCSASP